MEKISLSTEEDKAARKAKLASQTFEKKPKLTKEERRAQQEAQRLAKAAGAPAKTAPKAAAAPAPPTARMQAEIHPAILSLGLKYAEGKLVGGNARCVAMLTAFQQVIKDYHTPPDKVLRRDLDKTLRPLIQFLIDCRPHSIGMGNAIRYVRNVIATLDPSKGDDDAKTFVLDEIDQYIENRIVMAMTAVSKFACSKIVDGDVILTYARADIIEVLLKQAFDQKIQFRVLVVDSRPHFEGKKLIRALAEHGLPCTYIQINALSYVMKEVTKVFLGATAIMSNGAVVARVGTALCAMTAHEFNVPVLFCCETYKVICRMWTSFMF
ncbi:hypothetical protein B5M09_001543 [Aphanomyces astaci]|uniref:Translation initiation factor eIF2B subunit delta n=1 Tax=Aphanomyces astaci TaxID=112090 RepID=A0A3R7YCN4_APHAT|nr:hypothetical protein B5M09_001543 [Aphanomyces astaci]